MDHHLLLHLLLLLPPPGVVCDGASVGREEEDDGEAISLSDLRCRCLNSLPPNVSTVRGISFGSMIRRCKMAIEMFINLAISIIYIIYIILLYYERRPWGDNLEQILRAFRIQSL